MERQQELSWTERTRRTEPSAEGGPGGGPEETGPSELLRQARGWSAVAQDAYDTLARGEEAERELSRRRNNSGQ